MKKLFIGCGVVVFLALGFLGYVGYRIWPDVKAFYESHERFAGRLIDLDQRYAFQPPEPPALDAARFTAALEVRVEFKTGYTRQMEAFESSLRSEDESGFIAMAKASFRALADVADIVAGALEQAAMGPTEFEYQVRLLWATLESVDAGLGGEELAPLRGAYDKLRAELPDLRQEHPDLPPLEEIIGPFDADLVASARELLAADPQLVLDGIAEPWIEIMVYMSLSSLRSMEGLVGASVSEHAAQQAERDEGGPPR